MGKHRLFSIALLVFILSTTAFAQDSKKNEVDTFATKKNCLGINIGYLFALSNTDFTENYRAAPIISLFYDYTFHSNFKIEFGAGYSSIKVFERNLYALTFPVTTPNAGLPYSELVGGDLRIISIESNLVANTKAISGLQPYSLIGISYSFLEINPLDGFDKKGNYQIIQNYINENAIGVNLGLGLNYLLNKSVLIFAQAKHSILFTSKINQNAIGYLRMGFGASILF